MATRQSSQKALEALVPATPELIGGSADLTGSNLTFVKGMGTVEPGNFAGRYIHYGVREHGMAAAANGMALHGGLIPYDRAPSSSSPTTCARRSASARSCVPHVIHVLTHDSIGLGEDGPTHQPIEHLASLRAMPHLHVYRPADAMEVAECWELAIRRSDGPSLLVLTRQALPTMRTDTAENRCARGGYVLAEAEGPRAATLIATGSEVSIAMDARAAPGRRGRRRRRGFAAVLGAVLAAGRSVSYAGAGRARRGSASRRPAGFGWERWLGNDGVFIGMTGFGASAPYEDLYKHFGITPEAIVAAVRKRLG